MVYSVKNPAALVELPSFEFLKLVDALLGNDIRDGERQRVFKHLEFFVVKQYGCKGLYLFVLLICGIINISEEHKSSPLRELTFDTQKGILPSSRRNRCLIIPRVPRRIPRVTLASSQLLCGAWLLCRTLKSKLVLMKRSERGGVEPENLLPPALPAQRIRRPFLPPCQSPPRRLTAFPQSVIRRTETDLHRSTGYLLSHGYCSGTPVRQRSGTR